MDGIMDDRKMDCKRYHKINDSMSLQSKASYVRSSILSTSRKSSLYHVAKTLLILSGFCFLKLADGQESLELKYRLEEEQGGGTYVGDVFHDANLGKIYGSDSLQQLQFRILRVQNLFVIDNTSGIIRTNSQIDREAICPGAVNCDHRIDVALQPQSFFRIIRVSVVILDINDNSPQFEHDEQVVEVSESAPPGTVLLVPAAVDLDSPEFSVQSYRLVSDFDRFQIVGSGRRPDGTSEGKLMLTKSLDRETTDNYRLQIMATDGGFRPNSGTMDVIVKVLDVNDNSPVFEQSNYTVKVLENIAKQTTILQVRAVDADIGLNGEVVYGLSLPSLAAYGQLFGIDNASGDIYIKGDLDFEENSVYFLTIVARDRGAESIPVAASVTILVDDANDNAPEITLSTLSSSPGTAEIAENSMLGSFVAHFTAVDKDSGENGRFECQLNDSHFRIEEAYSNEYQILTAALVDREVQSSYSLTLTCIDFGDKPQETVQYLPVLITDVNDNDPVFSQTEYREEMIENNYVGKVLMTVNATDLDSDKNGDVTYSLSGESAEWFHIDPESGLITAAISFDRETTEFISFLVVAKDKGVPPRSSSALVRVTILDVNDQKPVFSPAAYSFAVMENLAPGAEVGAVAAHDRDNSIYGEVTYAILPTDGSDLFDIDHKTGVIVTMRTLDRESVSTYYLTVIASDREVPPLSSSASVTIYVSDENDNSPVFDYPAQNNNTIYISNRTPKGHVITRLRAYDLDVGQNGKVVFDVTDETKTEFFDVDMELGTVIVNRDLTELDGRLYFIDFVAKDEGVPQHMAFTRLNIVVNRSVAFLQERRDKPAISPQTLIILLITVISGAVIILLVITIIVVCRKGREKQAHSYNCRTESLKMFSKSSKPSVSDCSDFSAAAEHGSSTDERARKELSLSMEDHGVELAEERSLQSSSLNPYVIQTTQASSSLLGSSSANKLALNGAPSHISNASKFAKSEFRGSQTVPLLQENKEPEVNRIVSKALNDNDADSLHSGEGSNTDSGHGPSEEGESNTNMTRLFAVTDHHNNPMKHTPKCHKTNELQTGCSSVVPVPVPVITATAN